MALMGPMNSFTLATRPAMFSGLSRVEKDVAVRSALGMNSGLFCFYILQGCHTLRELRKFRETQGIFKLKKISGKFDLLFNIREVLIFSILRF